jgi:ribosomal protein S6
MKKVKKVENIDNSAEDVEQNNEDKRVYELGFLIDSAIGDEKIGEKFSSLKKIIEKNEGAFISEELPKIKKLEYTIFKSFHGKKERYDDAYFSWIKFEAIPASVDKIYEEFKKEDSVIRFIMVKTVKEDTVSIPVNKRFSVSSNGKEKPIVRKEKSSGVSEAELDKTIDDLVIE